MGVPNLLLCPGCQLTSSRPCLYGCNECISVHTLAIFWIFNISTHTDNSAARFCRFSSNWARGFKKCQTMFFHVNTIKTGQKMPNYAGPLLAGGQWCPPLSIWNRCPPFHVWPTGCCIHSLFNTLFLKCAPLSGFWPPLLLNSGDGPETMTYMPNTTFLCQTQNHFEKVQIPKSKNQSPNSNLALKLPAWQPCL